MKKENWALLLSGIAIFVSVVSICISCPHKAELGFDYQGILVGALSLLVTVLIGWNIYTLIDMKEASQKINRLKEEIEEKIKKTNTETQFSLKFEMLKTVPVLIAYQTGDLVSSMKLMFKEFYENKNNDSIAKIMAREYILNNIMGIINSDNKELTNHFVEDLRGALKIEEVEDFLHEYLSYSEEHRLQRYAGMQNVLLELLKAQS